MSARRLTEMAREMVATGTKPRVVARLFRVSPARISQIMRGPCPAPVPDDVPLHLRHDYRALARERGEAVARDWLALKMRAS